MANWAFNRVDSRHLRAHFPCGAEALALRTMLCCGGLALSIQARTASKGNRVIHCTEWESHQTFADEIRLRSPVARLRESFGTTIWVFIGSLSGALRSLQVAASSPFSAQLNIFARVAIHRAVCSRHPMTERRRKHVGKHAIVGVQIAACRRGVANNGRLCHGRCTIAQEEAASFLCTRVFYCALLQRRK